MLISALAGVLGSAFGGSLWIGLLTGLLASVAVSAVFAYFHLVLKANNVLCGTAVNTMASGLTVFVLQLATGEKGNSSSLKSFSFPNVDIPIIKDIPVLGGILSGHNALTYLALAMVVVIWFFLYKTPTGTSHEGCGRESKRGIQRGTECNKDSVPGYCIMRPYDRPWRNVSLHGLSDHVCARHDSRTRLYRPGSLLHGPGYSRGSADFIHDFRLF